MVINPSLAEYLVDIISSVHDRVSTIEKYILAHWRDDNAVLKLNSVDLQG